MVPADLARTGWFRAILPAKAGQADKDQAADVAGQVAARREEDKAASVDPAAEAVALAEHLAECLGAEAEEVVAPVAADAED